MIPVEQGKAVPKATESDLKKKSPDDERQEKIVTNLDEELSSLKDHSKMIDGLIRTNDGNARKIAMLVNAKARLAHEMFICISIMRDPKLRLTTSKGKNRDLARMLERTVRRQKSNASHVETSMSEKTKPSDSNQ